MKGGTISLSSSFRLAAKDQVNLYKRGGVINDDGFHRTQFSGWLIEEDFI